MRTMLLGVRTEAKQQVCPGEQEAATGPHWSTCTSCCRGLRLLETSILSMAIAVLQTYIGESSALLVLLW